MIVLDASAAVELVLNTGTGRRVADRIDNEREIVSAPHLIDVELVHVIRRYAMSGTISDERGVAALEFWRSLEVERYDHEPFIAGLWQLRHNFSAYDAAYVTLADALSAPLLTADRRLALAPTGGVSVEVY